MAKKNYKIVVIDTETGGLDPNIHSILSLGMVLLDSGKIIEKKLWNIAEENVNCTEEALSINKIDIQSHLKNADSVAKVLFEIEQSIPDSFKIYDNKSLIAGHNINFDKGFINRLGKLGGCDNFVDKLFGYRSLDTTSVLMFMNILGLYTPKYFSLEKACGFFGIGLNNAHNALADAVATAELLTKMVQIADTRQLTLFE